MSRRGVGDPIRAAEAPLLACRDLVVGRDGQTVLREIDLELAPGEIVVLLGPNGAGKSTLLDALAGTLAPEAGEIERRTRIAVALQSPDLIRGSVLDNVIAALTWWGVPRPERRRRAVEALTALGVESLATRRATELSGGERRRVHLARALAVRPGVLMLDEPFAGLDGAGRAALLEQTGAALREAAGAALVVVHDRAEAWALGDRLVVLIDGRVAATGAPRELLLSPPSREVARFLGFDGELEQPGGGVLLTRPQHVLLDPDGPLRGTVRQLIPTEDGIRLRLELPDGQVSCLAALPSPRPGDEVHLRIEGGVRFPGARPPAGSQGDPVVDPAAAQPEIP